MINSVVFQIDSQNAIVASYKIRETYVVERLDLYSGNTAVFVSKHAVHPANVTYSSYSIRMSVEEFESLAVVDAIFGSKNLSFLENNKDRIFDGLTNPITVHSDDPLQAVFLEAVEVATYNRKREEAYEYWVRRRYSLERRRGWESYRNGKIASVRRKHHDAALKFIGDFGHKFVSAFLIDDTEKGSHQDAQWMIPRHTLWKVTGMAHDQGRVLQRDFIVKVEDGIVCQMDKVNEEFAYRSNLFLTGSD